MAGSGSPVSVRISPQERNLLESAAAQARTNLSDYIRSKAVEAAEMVLLDQKLVTIPAEAWETFEAWAAAPARDVAGLRDLAASVPVWRA